MEAEFREKLAYGTRSGLWQWKVVPTGLGAVSATVHKLMEKVLQGLHWQTLLLYVDNIIVVADDFPTHISRLAAVFQRLRTAGLKLQPERCRMLRDRVAYRGHVVSSQGVIADPDRIVAVQRWTSPSNHKELQVFLGTLGYYRRYIENYATLAKPLYQFNKKKTRWEWNGEAQRSFKVLKERLTTAPILSYPRPDQEYILDTDASAYGVGAVHSQERGAGNMWLPTIVEL